MQQEVGQIRVGAAAVCSTDIGPGRAIINRAEHMLRPACWRKSRKAGVDHDDRVDVRRINGDTLDRVSWRSSGSSCGPRSPTVA